MPWCNYVHSATCMSQCNTCTLRPGCPIVTICTLWPACPNVTIRTLRPACPSVTICALRPACPGVTIQAAQPPCPGGTNWMKMTGRNLTRCPAWLQLQTPHFCSHGKSKAAFVNLCLFIGIIQFILDHLIHWSRIKNERMHSVGWMWKIDHRLPTTITGKWWPQNTE